MANTTMATPTCRDRIILAPENLVRAVLLSLCQDKEVETTIMARLDALTGMENAAQASGGEGTALREPAICIQCEEPFYEDANYDSACEYHPGEMEPDYESDFWADHDERIHGTIDSDWARKEYPGGFIWDCCDENAEEAPGCTESCHRSEP